MSVAAFLSYVFLTAYTPGPNNIMAMSNAGKYGFIKGFRFNLGVLIGFMIVMLCCALFTTTLYTFIPKIEPYMVFFGAAYILWLAWIIWRDKPSSGKGFASSNSIISGLLLQFVNVKVILYGITAISVFILPYYSGLPEISAFILLLALIGFSGTCCWALFGAVFERFLNEHRRGTNAIMALLLVYCALSQIMGSITH